MSVRTITIITLLGSLLLIALGACGGDTSGTTPAETLIETTAPSAATETTVRQAPSSTQDTERSEFVSSFRQAHSIDTLVEKTDVAFIGVPTGVTEEIRVQGRNLNDPTELVADQFSVGTLRQYRVERYLSGDGPDLVNVLQYYHTRESRVDGALRISTSASLADYDPPTTGDRYLLFLKTDPLLPNVYGAYYEPSRFSLKNGEVVPDSPWIAAYRDFEPDNEQAVVSKVEAARDN